MEAVEFVLCLDSLGTPNAEKLFMIVSKSPKKPEVAMLYQVRLHSHLSQNHIFDISIAALLFQQFSDVASTMALPFELVHKKINASANTVDWAHERFSRRSKHIGVLVCVTDSDRFTFS